MLLVMNKYLPVLLFALTTTACDVYVVEPRIDKRDYIVGYYSVDEYSKTYNDYTVYSFRISKSRSSYDAISFDNFYASDLRVKAYVYYDEITIPYQVVNGYEIEGSGIVHGNTLHLSYRVRDLYEHTPTDFCDTEAHLDY